MNIANEKPFYRLAGADTTPFVPVHIYKVSDETLSKRVSCAERSEWVLGVSLKTPMVGITMLSEPMCCETNILLAVSKDGSKLGKHITAEAGVNSFGQEDLKQNRLAICGCVEYGAYDPSRFYRGNIYNK